MVYAKAKRPSFIVEFQALALHLLAYSKLAQKKASFYQ